MIGLNIKIYLLKNFVGKFFSKTRSVFILILTAHLLLSPTDVYAVSCKKALTPRLNIKENVQNIFKFIWNNMSEEVKTPAYVEPYRLSLKIDAMFGPLGIDIKNSMSGSHGFPASIELAAQPRDFKDKTPLQSALMIAHEIGHIVGHRASGSYYPIQELTMVGEGEAEYQSVHILRDVYQNNKEEFKQLILDPTRFEGELMKLAQKTLNSKSEFDSKVVVAHFLNMEDLPIKDEGVSIDGMDLSPPVKETLRDYPSRQGRMDTIIAAVKGKERPQVWAAPKDFE